jgi:hypothetical protein
VPFSKIFPSSRSLNLLKNGLESPGGKVLEFHLHQRVDTLPRSAWITLHGATPCNQPLYIYCIYTLSNFYSSLNLEVQVSTIQNILRMFLIYNGYRTRNFDPGNYQVNFAKQDYLKYSYFIRVDYGTNYPESLKLLTIYILLKINYRFTIRVNLLITPFLEYFNLCI